MSCSSVHDLIVMFTYLFTKWWISLFSSQGREWFAGDCNRKTAEELLMSVNKVKKPKLSGLSSGVFIYSICSTCKLNFFFFPCWRTVPFSSAIAQPRALVSPSPWLCSSSRGFLTFQSASWRRPTATLLGKRARKMKRWVWTKAETECKKNTSIFTWFNLSFVSPCPSDVHLSGRDDFSPQK